MFEKLNHEEHLNEYPFYKELGIDLEEYGKIDRKIEKDIYSTVDQDNKTPFPVELDDLTRLHFLVLSRKVTTILEFGVGKSTLVFNDALKLNKQKHEKYIKDNLRRSNLFECHSVEHDQHFFELREQPLGKYNLSQIEYCLGKDWLEDL